MTFAGRAWLGAIVLSAAIWSLILAGLTWWLWSSPTGELVLNDRGGRINQRVLQLQLLALRDQYIRPAKPDSIIGLCASSCTIRLANPPHLVCIGPGAVLAFHRATEERRLASGRVVMVDSPSGTARLMALYPAWVKRWIRSRGGLKRELDYMPLSYASRFVRRCA